MRNDEEIPAKAGNDSGGLHSLQLNPVFSADMIRKSGNTFRATEEHIIYQMLLNSYYQNSIYECNEILQANNCKPLTKEE